VRRLAVRTLAAHRARLVMTLAAVCLGAAFVAGTLFFTASVEVTGALRNALLGFAGLALLVGSLVIANTFSMLVGQRTRELALLRAIGLSRRQLRRLVLGEALVVGLAGGVAGTAFGGGFAAVTVRVQDTPASFAFSWLAVLAGLTVGVGVTVLSAWASARRAARIAPVAAMRSEITSLRADLRRRTIAGLVVAAPGVALYAYAALTDAISEQVGLVGIAGTGLLILAVALLAPALCRLVLRPLSAPVARFSAIGRLAAGNA
jgi:putative ABC transport system permease protein